MSPFDVVVIGAGPAGEKGAAQAAYFGKRVAIVERAAEPGGAAVHTGTLPSKTLRETAMYLSGYRARELYGVSVALDPEATVAKLIARKAAIEVSESARIRANLARHDVTLVRGAARFVDAHTVEVTGPEETRRLSADHFLIATGSRPFVPPEIRVEHPEIYDSDEILALDRIPASLTILGAGVIGCEYACMFAALGTRVNLVEARPTFLGFLDRELVAALGTTMEKLGIAFHLGSRWSEVRDSDGAISTTLADGRVIVGEKLLFAAGRIGNTAGLGLEALGIAPDARGNLAVDARYRTAVPHIYAAGDVIGFPALASVSMDQARVAMCHAFGEHYKSAISQLVPYGIYTIPEVSAVGETEETCRAKQLDYVVGRAYFCDNARGKIVGDCDGLIKLIVEAKTRRLIGVHILGDSAAELVAIGLAVMQLKGAVDVFIDMIFNYPTLSEAFKYAAYDALGKLPKG